MKRVMLDDEGRSAGAETNMPAELADKIKKNPPARLRILVSTIVAQRTERVTPDTSEGYPDSTLRLLIARFRPEKKNILTERS